MWKQRRGSRRDGGARSARADAELPRAQAPVEEGDPQPAHQQEDEHEREGEREPGAEVDQFAVWKIAGRQRKRLTPPELGRLSVSGGWGGLVTFSAVRSG